MHRHLVFSVVILAAILLAPATSLAVTLADVRADYAPGAFAGANASGIPSTGGSGTWEYQATSAYGGSVSGQIMQWDTVDAGGYEHPSFNHTNGAVCCSFPTVGLVMPAGGVPLGKIGAHPSDAGNEPAFVDNILFRWTNTSGFVGNLVISGDFQRPAGDSQGGVGLKVQHFNGVSTYTDLGTVSIGANDASIHPYSFNSTLAAGEEILFYITAVDNHFSDSTFMTAIIDGTPVPEPSTFAIASLGLATLLLFRRRK